MKVTDQGHLDQVLLIFWNHSFILLVDDVVGQGLLRLILQKILNPIIDINPLPLVSVAYTENELAKDFLIKDIILKHRQD